MNKPPFDFLRDGQQHHIALVGGGGKTTLLYELSTEYARQGKRVVAMTSTHMLVPAEKSSWARNEEAVTKLWQQGKYAVVGELEEGSGKLVLPSKALYDFALSNADIIIFEADGAKHKSVKVPRVHEPVILEECDIVIGVVGLEAIGQTWQQACFSWEQAEDWLAIEAEAKITIDKLAQLLLDERGIRKGVATREYYLVLNKLDLLDSPKEAERLRKLLVEKGMDAQHIWIRGKEG